MSKRDTFGAHLTQNGISRRAFLKLCSTMATLLAIPAGAMPALKDKLSHSVRPPVIWLSFQECTGCTESFTRSHAPTIESLIFDYISLDYHHTLQAASGEGAEAAKADTIKNHFGQYILIVDGSIPVGLDGAYSTIAGRTNLDILQESAEGAAAVIAIGTCATFGGLPGASPNPTGAMGVGDLMKEGSIPERTLINLPGCPPLPIAISGVLAHYLVFDRFPALDKLNRPLIYYGETVHDRCSRYHYYQKGMFAEQFDDEGARKGWCLYKLGCKGPVTHNSCAVHKWNEGTSFPIESGHPCIGCSEPGFWDRGGFYKNLDEVPVPAQGRIQSTDSTATSGVEHGEIVYEDNCVYCHSANTADLETKPSKVADLLRSGEIRSHRRLDISDEQLNALEKYLKSTK
ncbi:MAG: hydrogenase small subunit [Gammaproteobacteria bacterium]|nr:hydrogenase small subunit [Gammaproteobacteria bacterium]